MLSGAERVVIMALGESKAGAMQQAIDRRDSALPVALVLRRAGRSVVLVDEAAASLTGRCRR